MKRLLVCTALLAAACGRQASVETSAVLFREAAEATGLRFHHFTGATGEFYMPEIMGAGAALLDYDNDGDLDVYLAQSTVFDPRRKPEETLFPPPPGFKPGNRLFRNELVPSGTLRFTDVTEEARLGYAGYCMGAATGDYDNDGFVDLYVTCFGSNVLYHNEGDGTFRNVTRQAGVDDPRWSTSAAFVDYDRDGDLDLFVLNYVDFTLRGNKICYAATGERDYCTPKAYQAVPDRLFRNEGNGRFQDVSVSSGIAPVYGPGLGITCSDLNGDGWIDVYIANDTAANILWINQRDGTFRDTALTAGAAYSEDGLPKAGMGVSAGDFDNDGDDDLIVVNLRREGCTLFENNGRGEFQDVTLRHGLGALTFPYTGFGLDWFDYDRDGWLDLFVANGAVTRIESLRGERYPFHERNLLLRNASAGRGFQDVSRQGGAAFEFSEVSRGAAFGDVDNDGDVDIVVTNNNGPVRLLLNDTRTEANWLGVKLEGVQDNRLGLGARVGVLVAGGRTLWRRCHTDSSYLSASDPRVYFGLGRTQSVEGVVVIWPNGTRERWDNVGLNRLVTLRQGTGRPQGF